MNISRFFCNFFLLTLVSKGNKEKAWALVPFHIGQKRVICTNYLLHTNSRS